MHAYERHEKYINQAVHFCSFTQSNRVFRREYIIDVYECGHFVHAHATMYTHMCICLSVCVHMQACMCA
jgi:hypothetical protein